MKSSVTLSRDLSIRRPAVSLPATGADPSCPKTDVTHEPRNAASPASTASHPANVTIAIAPLGGAGREENNPYKDIVNGNRKKCFAGRIASSRAPHARHSGARGDAEGGVSRTRNLSMGVSVEPNTPGFRVQSGPLRGTACPGMTSVEALGNDECGALGMAV